MFLLFKGELPRGSFRILNRDAEIPDLVHPVRPLLAPGPDRTGALPNRMATTPALPNRRNSRRLSARSRMGTRDASPQSSQRFNLRKPQ